MNRKQRVVLNASTSDLFSLESSVPQGLVLGPLLFLSYINDIEIGIKSKIVFFADDTMIYSVAINPSRTASDLNHDLTAISKGPISGKWHSIPNPTSKLLNY